MKQTLGLQRTSYRQGLVLGLTMAEIMLLMVFTMLLVAGALLQKSQARIDELEKEQEPAAVAAEKKELESLRNMLTSVPRRELPDNWRELVRINDEIKQLQGKSADPQNVGQILEAAGKTKTALESLGYRLTDANQIADTIAKNMPPAERTASIDRAGHDWPPIIRLSEADNYSFELGKAEIATGFRQQLVDTIVPKLLELIAAYDVDVIEVIGHTDEVPIVGLTSNLDTRLVDTLRGRSPPDELSFSDNAGLAMARASAVSRVLMEDRRLAAFRILPLSGAQVITTEEKVSDGEYWHETAARRRIEIRLRRTSVVQ